VALHRHIDDLDPGEELLVSTEQGATNGFCLGIALYDKEEYRKPGVHDDQEGFFVLEGHGTARVGDEEFEVRPGSAFIAQKGVPHTVKRAPDSPPVRILYAHGAVCTCNSESRIS